jgi:NAD(P)H-flavin reductase
MMDHDPSVLPRPFRVVSNTRLTSDVVTIELESTDEGAPIRCEPGQFNMLYRLGVGEVPISASSSPDEPLLGHTIRSVGAATRSLCTAVPGELVGVRGPFGHPWPMTAAEGGDLLIIAGGIGLAPLRPAILAALAQRDRYRRISILYGARTPADLLFLNEQRQWSNEADQFLTTVDAASEDWTGDVGVVTALLRRARFDPQYTAALICGPEIMMRFTARALMDQGVDPGRIAVSLERSFSCATGLCGKCQLGPKFICKDGPVFRYPEVAELLTIPEL